MKCQFALELKKTKRGGRGWFCLESIWHLRMHLYKQYTGSLMTTLSQGAVASVCCRKSSGKRFNHVYPFIANKLSDSAFKFTCQSTDEMSQFRSGHVSHCQLCDLKCVSLCLSACPAKSYFQCWSGWSTLSHFQERGCECTSKMKKKMAGFKIDPPYILNWFT